ncbi:MAG TPA: trypsin-like peptidase domain-containing protein [Nitrososphaeraceae archaeon]|nr:trypsin-like peptidase domain-containing protein [Nitrososphaeraceae archaeon]
MIFSHAMLQRSKLKIVLSIIFVFATINVLLISQHSVMAQQQQQQNSTAVDVVSAKDNESSLSLNSIFKQVENSVVQITRKVPPSSILPPTPESENATTLGSGFVYDNKGRIITNNHVVGDAKIVDITLVDGNRYTANVIGTDIFSDIAVIGIVENLTEQSSSSPPPLRPLLIGNSSELEVGEQVIAIGNPFGLAGTMTTGIISQTGRLLPDQQTGFSIPNAIQTDTLINPGNSGGPLLNMNGQVIGMNTAGLFGSGIGFAVPSNAITRIVPALIEKGNYTHPWLGFTAATLTSDLAESVEGLERNFKGVLADSIVKDGPADKAGIQGRITDQYGEKHGGDIITAVDGRNVIQNEDLISYIEENKEVGDKITFTIYRNGQFLDLEMTIQERPSPLLYLTEVPSPVP